MINAALLRTTPVAMLTRRTATVATSVRCMSSDSNDPRKVTLGSIVGGPAESIEASASVMKATTKMVTHKIGSLAVTKDGVFCGIITTADYLKMGWAAKDAGVAAMKSTVGDVATMHPKSIVTATADTTVVEGLRMLMDNNVRHLPVVEDDVPVGMVSIKDLSMACLKYFEESA